MSTQFTNRFWKRLVPAGITVGLLGFWAPAGAEEEKVPEPKSAAVKVEGEGRKEEGRKEEPRREERRKEESRREESRKEEPRKEGQGSKDAQIEELAKMVKQLSGQVNELREQVQGLRAGFPAGAPNPEEMRRRMEEMQKKFAGANPGLNPERMREEMEKHREEMMKKLKAANPSLSEAEMKEKMEKHMQEMAKKFTGLRTDPNLEKNRAEMEKRAQADREKFTREGEGGLPGGDAETQIRRQIELLNAELKKIKAAKEREGGDKPEKKEGGDKKEGDRKDGDKKEGDPKEVKNPEEK